MSMNNAWICLGRNGDICNILPLVYADKLAGNMPTLVTTPEYVPLLEGVSYCDVMEVSCAYSDVPKAVELANESKRFDSVRVAQVHGALRPGLKYAYSYALDSYGVAGRPHDFGLAPLVFDQRDMVREADLLGQLATDKPMLLIGTEGISSPFADGAAVKARVRKEFACFNIVDLDGIRFHRLFDVIGLMEKASILITSDTVWVHLANAVPNLPVVLFHAESFEGWGQSPIRPQQVIHLPYSDAIGLWQRTVTAVHRVWNEGPKKRRIFHAYSLYDHSRHDFARSTWPLPSKSWVDCPTRKGPTGRNSDEMVRDPKSVPMIIDIVDAAVHAGADDTDIILLSNDDICFGTNFPDRLLSLTNELAWTHRRDFYSVTKHLSQPAIWEGQRQCGVDTHVFSARWWKRNRVRFPKMFVAREAWDLIMLKMLMEDGACRIPPCTYHQLHDSFWIRKENAFNPGNVHNQKLARAWMAAHGYNNLKLMDPVCFEEDIS